VDALLVWAVRAIVVATLIAVPAYAWHVRGRRYAIFSSVILGLSLPGALLMHARLIVWIPEELRLVLEFGFVYSLAAAGIHLASLVTPRLRHAPFRWGISIPGQWCITAGFFSGVWLLLLLPVRALLLLFGQDAALEALGWADLVPFSVALASLVTSTRPVREIVRIVLGDPDGPAAVERVPVERYRRRSPAPLEARPLRIVQVSDPHLGPWQPITKLSRHLDDLIAHDPDLVLLTGDFLTMEGRGSPGALALALEPMRKVAGRAYAIFGNHDHEDSDEVRTALEQNGVRLLVDEEALVETAVGPVQLVGADYVGRGREEHIPALLARYPRRDGTLRLLLLHDPLGFQFVPRGEVDLTLSGHTHGGQIGLVSFGLDWTVLTRSRWPDHGLFGNGSNRLYVHRGTGFYGFPMRVGVPGEASLLELVLPEPSGS
jgi:predicted MPP superfamily phosphohydrolase